MTLRVGDLVSVGRACLANPEGARAVVVEIYQLHRTIAPGAMLLFENGSADGFSEGDLELFKVEPIGHEPRLEAYRFTNVLALDRDFKGGVFSCAWATGAGAAPAAAARRVDPRDGMGLF